MGTLFQIKVWVSDTNKDDSHLDRSVERAFARINQLNQIFSDYLLNSEVNQLRKTAAHEQFHASDDLLYVLKQSQELFEKTNGNFDVTIGPMVQLWRRARKNNRLPSSDQIAVAKSRTGFDKLIIDYSNAIVTKTVEHMVLDFGGIVKGYAADEALRILKESGYSYCLVAASGDIALGQSPEDNQGWRVGLETMEMTEPSEASFTLANAAVSTSGDTKRFLEIDGQRYSHIVDKQSGLGLTDRIAVSVIAPTALISDSYATSVSLMGVEKGIAWINQQPNIECRIVTVVSDQQTQIYYSENFPKN